MKLSFTINFFFNFFQAKANEVQASFSKKRRRSISDGRPSKKSVNGVDANVQVPILSTFVFVTDGGLAWTNGQIVIYFPD